MALSAHQIGRAHHRRETRHWRIAGRAISERVAVQTDFPRSLGHQAPNVTRSPSCLAFATPYLISLTPRFSKVHGQVCCTTASAVYSFTHKKPLKRLESSRSRNSQLKQGVNESVNRLSTSIA